MLAPDDLWWIEEPIGEPFDVSTLREIKQRVAQTPWDDELGLRSLLERPDVLSRAWWRENAPRCRRSPGNRQSSRRYARRNR